MSALPADSARPQPVVLAITGASGAAYGVGVLRGLVGAGRPVQLIVSSHGERILALEMGINSPDDLRKACGESSFDRWVTVFDRKDRGATPASGSAVSVGMIICPCSMGTLSAISVGASRSLIERAADVALKERRKVVLVPRETPLSAIHLQNMLRLSRAGAVILPAAPGLYNRPTGVQDMINFIVARVLDQFAVPHSLQQRWKSGE